MPRSVYSRKSTSNVAAATSNATSNVVATSNATSTSNVNATFGKAATPQTMIIESLNAMKKAPSQDERVGHGDDDTSGTKLFPLQISLFSVNINS